MTEKQRLAYEAMSPEKRAAVDRIRAKHATPEFRAQEVAIREAVMKEVPPAKPPKVIKVFAEQLRQARENCGLSLTEAAAKVGIDKGALSRLEAGHANPTLATLDRVATVLGLQLSLKPAMTRSPKSSTSAARRENSLRGQMQKLGVVALKRRPPKLTPQHKLTDALSKKPSFV